MTAVEGRRAGMTGNAMDRFIDGIELAAAAFIGIQVSGCMTPSASMSNSYPRQVTCEVKKVRHHTQSINKSRTGGSQRSDARFRSPRRR